MKYFDEFVSNTLAAGGNQFIFQPEGIRTGRIFYRITVGGKMEYSFLFSNVLDSTFQNGAVSQKNRICPPWMLISAKVARCPAHQVGLDFMKEEQFEAVHKDLSFVALPLANKEVAPGEFFATEPIELEFEKGEYLCLELTYQGKEIPYHAESLLPIYNLEEQGWVYDKKMPIPGMVGCRRKVQKRIAYLGDSITQGIGCPKNSYLHWNALLSEKLGDSYSFWNLGLGYGRADDLASLGAWMYKAKHCDTAIVCYGVNDLRRGFSVEQIQKNLTAIIEELKKAGVQVILQTVPPYPYSEEQGKRWFALNDFIRHELADKADYVFDNVPVLQAEEGGFLPKYGGHPKPEGCRLWAEALYEFLRGYGI